MLQNHRLGAPNWLWPSLVAGLLWCAAALSAGYWFLQMPVGGAQTPPSKVLPAGVESALGAHQGMARAWGVSLAQPAQTTAAGQFQLLGVIAGADGRGSALIATDSQAPKIYRVGQSLGDGLVLQSLSPRGAQFGASLKGPAQLELKLPVTPLP